MGKKVTIMNWEMEGRLQFCKQSLKVPLFSSDRSSRG